MIHYSYVQKNISLQRNKNESLSISDDRFLLPQEPLLLTYDDRDQ